MKKIFVYGVGANFFEYESFIRERYEIIGFFDSNPDKQGSFLYGLEILNPERISECEFDYILITPNPYEEIKAALISRGLNENSILILHKELVSTSIDNDIVNISFSIGCGSGLGDILIALNYVYCWAQKYKNEHCKIAVICDRFSDLIENLGNTGDYIDRFIYTDDHKADIVESDLYILVRRYPRILKSKDYKISVLCPEIIDYILQIKKFSVFHPELMGIELLADGKSVDYEKFVHHKRIQQPDVFDNIGIKEEYSITPSVNCSVNEKFNLQGNKYITIHRGCDKKLYNNNNVKLWDEKNYDQIIKMIKNSYPDIKIVLLGDDYERSEKISGYDLDLLGKTDFEALKCILKNAVVHIDTEGGLVHLRHAVKGGPSVVLFGPTDPNFFGYSENINIRTDACPTPCEWKRLDWITNCTNVNKHCCMESITPETVFSKVVNVINT